MLSQPECNFLFCSTPLLHKRSTMSFSNLLPQTQVFFYFIEDCIKKAVNPSQESNIKYVKHIFVHAHVIGTCKHNTTSTGQLNKVQYEDEKMVLCSIWHLTESLIIRIICRFFSQEWLTDVLGAQIASPLPKGRIESKTWSKVDQCEVDLLREKKNL